MLKRNLLRRRNLIVAIALAGFLIRLAVIAWAQTYTIPPDRDHYSFGYESGRIAKSLAVGEGFSSPMPFPTGPTAHLAPVYPVLLSGIFRVFGVYTAASAIAAFVLNSMADAFTCVILFCLGTAVFGEIEGLVAAALFAFYPTAIWFASGTVWDTSVLALCLAALALWFYLQPIDPAPTQFIVTGLWIGLGGLVNPIICLPGFVGLLWMWSRLPERGLKRFWKPVLAAGAAAFVMLPWMIRNAVMVHEFTPRSAFGVNFRQGNSPSAVEAGNGAFQLAIAAPDSPAEGLRMRELGEAAYDRECLREGLAFVRDHPEQFIRLTWVRIRGWWLGYDSQWNSSFHVGFDVAFWKRVLPALWLPLFVAGFVLAVRARRPVLLLAGMILIYPVPYYFTIVSMRYRFPTEPLMMVMVAFLLTEIARRIRRPKVA